MLFDQEFPPGTTWVRVVVLTKKKGQPPILWEGLPDTSTTTVIRQISRNKRIVEWLYKSGHVHMRTATVDLQLQGYAGRKRIVVHKLPGYSFIVRGRRRAGKLGDEIVIRSFDLVERTLELMAQLILSRDAVVGRVADIGIRSLDAPPAAASPAQPSPGETLSQIIEALPRLAEMARTFRQSRGSEPS